MKFESLTHDELEGLFIQAVDFVTSMKRKNSLRLTYTEDTYLLSLWMKAVDEPLLLSIKNAPYQEKKNIESTTKLQDVEKFMENLDDLSPQDAMVEYIHFLNEKFYDWRKLILKFSNKEEEYKLSTKDDELVIKHIKLFDKKDIRNSSTSDSVTNNLIINCASKSTSTSPITLPPTNTSSTASASLLKIENIELTNRVNLLVRKIKIIEMEKTEENEKLKMKNNNLLKLQKMDAESILKWKRRIQELESTQKNTFFIRGSTTTTRGGSNYPSLYAAILLRIEDIYSKVIHWLKKKPMYLKCLVLCLAIYKLKAIGRIMKKKLLIK